MLISMDLKELQTVTMVMGQYIADNRITQPTHPAITAHNRLSGELRTELKQREPVTVAVSACGATYTAMLNPVSNEVEVRIGGVPVMSGEWAEVWRDERDAEDLETEYRIHRDRDYPNQPQPDDETLAMLSSALRYALNNRWAAR